MFAAQLRRSHSVVAYVDVYRKGVKLASKVRVSAGSVNVDAGAKVRRRCSLRMPYDSTLADQLRLGAELVVYRGLVLPTGVEEAVRLGTFNVKRRSAKDAGAARELSIEGFDRSRKAARARLTRPLVFPAGTNAATAIVQLVVSALPSLRLTWTITSTTRTTPLVVLDVGADPWEEATKLARSIGYQLFFDVYGQPVLRPQPDGSAAETFTYAEGSDSVLLEASDDVDDEPGYNGVVAIGTGTADGVPVYGEVFDENPASDTYARGDYGLVPKFLESEYISTQEQATAAAGAEFQRLDGLTRTVAMVAIPNPAHDADDVVRVTRAAIAVDERLMLHSFAIPLAYSERISFTARRIATAA